MCPGFDLQGTNLLRLLRILRRSFFSHPIEFKNTKFLLLFSFLRRFVKMREYLLFRDCVYQKSESIEKIESYLEI